jgi:hypothetical protein
MRIKTAYRVTLVRGDRTDVFYVRPTGRRPESIRRDVEKMYRGGVTVTAEPGLSELDVVRLNGEYLGA